MGIAEITYSLYVALSVKILIEFDLFKAKRVILYLGRAKPERIVDEIMSELQTVEALNFTVERTQTPPFFRLTPVNKRSGGGAVEECEDADDEIVLDKGQIHTKRRSGEDPTRTAEWYAKSVVLFQYMLNQT